MAAPIPPLRFNTAFDAETGRPVPVAPGLVRITAPNAGPYTFKGTNSFLLGDARLAVVDPGPSDERHLAALLEAIAGRPVEAILLTHTHRDHSDLARRLAAETGAPIWFGGQHRLSRAARPLEANGVGRESDFDLVPDRTLSDGERLSIGEIELEVVATPGHCANHLAFGRAGTPWLLTGDHVMGWNSTLVSVPDGSMADYIDSLERVIGLPYGHYLPAHGGAIDEGPDHARALLAHRQQRNAQVVAAVERGTTGLQALRRAIYPDLAPPLWPAALMTLKAHVEYLADRGEISVSRGVFGPRLAPGRA